VDLPPDEVFDILVDEDNHKVFKAIKARAHVPPARQRRPQARRWQAGRRARAAAAAGGGLQEGPEGRRQGPPGRGGGAGRPVALPVLQRELLHAPIRLPGQAEGHGAAQRPAATGRSDRSAHRLSYPALDTQSWPERGL